ncbi:MAG: PAS domain-containing protein [Deltaproteobacteria bacterium]|nr:PAS domain-containing protein [Deltaproteobacteria bacterium]
MESEKGYERVVELKTVKQPVVYACAIEGDKFVPVFISANFYGIWGFKEEEVLGDSEWWSKHLHPEERRIVLKNFANIFNAGCHTQEYRFRHMDGSYHWVYDRLRLVRDERGVPKEIVGLWLDIDEFKVEGI